jgi:hypothetical protein
MKRYQEVLNRKRHGVKYLWFTPLSKIEVEKLGYDKKSREVGI